MIFIVNQYIIYVIIIFLFVLISLWIIPTKKEHSQKSVIPNKQYKFKLKGKGKTLWFADPFDNFLVYGGANSGKTKSIGKPLLHNYIQSHFAGFIYDYKDFDLTKTANHLCRVSNYPYKVYNISFTDLDKTHRTNPIKPSVVGDENLFVQLIDDFLNAYILDSKRDEWFNGALGILKGVAYNFFHLHKEICTLPHIANFVCSAGAERIGRFLEGTYEGRTLGSAFIEAKQSPRTQASYLSSLTNYLSSFAFNKNLSYVLTGDDFDFNLIDPMEPKLVCVANSYKIENLISPVIGLMVTLTSRHLSLENRIPLFYFLDEATTFKITDFEKMPSVLREYLCSFVLISQSGAKVEKMYGKLDRSSIEANFSNQFFGRTKDIEALKYYPLVFGKYDKQRKSRTTGTTASGSNRSQTISTQKEDRYEGSFFTRLNSGEFIGTAAHSNVKDFLIRFQMYEETESPLQTVNIVVNRDLQKCFESIIHDVSML
jgi:type IV secretory pathway TraG/TraD family ATPase VirD4